MAAVACSNNSGSGISTAFVRASAMKPISNSKPDVLKKSTRAKGAAGEEKATEYLLDRGYAIVCRNYRSRKGEIDCIARDTDGTLVFIEVKASSTTQCCNPLFRINPAKQRTIFAMAQQYLAEHHITSAPCRFDVIGIVGDSIDHLRNAMIRM
jgi:putative endonuclease